MLRGEITAPNHYWPAESKIEGTKLTPYYSTKRSYSH
jgi:hypothetical protein